MEAYRLEYDCSVKYEEHGASKEEEAPQQTSRLTTNFSKIILDSINSEVIIMYKVVLQSQFKYHNLYLLKACMEWSSIIDSYWSSNYFQM